MTFRYYYGERGITASFVVTDPYLCYNDAAYSVGEAVSTSDTVGLFLDVKNNNGTTPQTDDLRFTFLVDGRMEMYKGDGATWASSNDSIEYQVVADGELNKSDGGAKDVSWTVEFFLPYETYSIDKDSTMGLLLYWVDSNAPLEAGTYHYWYDNAWIFQPREYNPIDKNGLAFAAPEGWVPSMGRYVTDETGSMVAEDVKALAYYTNQTLTNGAGTVEVTFDISNTDNFFADSHFSGLLLGVEDVGETEKPGWEAKNHYGVFLNNNKNNPELIVASIRVVDGRVNYTQLASGYIMEVLPDYLKSMQCTVKVCKNGGWMELYMKDAKGEYQHMYDVYDAEAINGNYVGIRTVHKGFAIRDLSISSEAPAAVEPYEAPGFKAYMGLVQKIGDDQFLARTSGTVATFGSLINRYSDSKKTTTLKSFTTSLTMPKKPNMVEDKIKGIMVAYDPENQSKLIIDYSYREKEWGDYFKVYVRQRKPTEWGAVEYVMDAEPETKYDFRVTPIEQEDGTLELLIEYKKATESNWKTTYCKNAEWVMSGTEYGVETGAGNMQFGAFHVEDSEYTRMETDRYKIVKGAFLARKDGGLQVLKNDSTAIDTAINKDKKDSYAFETSLMVAADRSGSIKGYVIDYEKTDDFITLDYRWEEERNGYGLYMRRLSEKGWGDVKGFDIILEEGQWYDMRVSVINGKRTTTVVVECKKQGETEYICRSRSFDFAVSGRQVAYVSDVANGQKFGLNTEVTTTFIGAEDSRYQIVRGAFRRVGDNVQAATTESSFMVDKKINFKKWDRYTMDISFRTQVEPDSVTHLKGFVFNYDEETDSYLLLDYWKTAENKYYLCIRQKTSDGNWEGFTDWNRAIEVSADTWYTYRLSVTNDSKSTIVSLTGADGTSYTHTFSAMSGRGIGYQSDTAKGLTFGPVAVVEYGKNPAGINWSESWSEALKGFAK